MKYVLSAAVLAAGLILTTGTASAQHHDGRHHGNYQSHAPRYNSYSDHSHASRWNSYGRYSYSPRVEVLYAPRYGSGRDVYVGPGCYTPSIGIFSGSLYGGSYYSPSRSYGPDRYHHHHHHHH